MRSALTLTMLILAAPLSAQEMSGAEAAYRDSVEVRNVQVAEAMLSDRGVFGELKNLGSYTVNRVEITVYYLDNNGVPMFEKTFVPVRVSDSPFSSPPMKPPDD